MAARKSGEEAVFFSSQAELRRWLEKHHQTAEELWVGCHKVGTGKPSVTWKQIVDEVLCFGWIDGARYTIDEERWQIRLTPRRKGSVWSEVNTKRMKELIAAGLVAPKGLEEFEKRDREKTKQYSYEERTRGLGPEYERRLKANKKAWAFFEAQAPSYRRTASWWVMSAKREETRESRLGKLIEDSASGRTLVGLTRPASKR